VLYASVCRDGKCNGPPNYVPIFSVALWHQITVNLNK
jgi:hypothetical protein